MSNEHTVRVPPYYEIPGLHHHGRVLQVMDITDAMATAGLGWNFNHGCILKYLIRGGRKPEQSRLKDATKLLRCAAREVRRLGGDLPGDL